MQCLPIHKGSKRFLEALPDLHRFSCSFMIVSPLLSVSAGFSCFIINVALNELSRQVELVVLPD